MSGLYPSLEDMTVGKMANAQLTQQRQQGGPPPAIPSAPYQPPPSSATPGPTSTTVVAIGGGGLYPSLEDYMGLELSRYAPPPRHGPGGAVVPSAGTAVATRENSGPVTGIANVGIRRAEIKQGVREITLCKDGKGKCGLSLFSVSKGVFVCFVAKGSPASMAGLRFGDQILMINGEVVAGYKSDKASKLLKTAPANEIKLAVRDRPFERTITMQKDSANHIGFSFKDGQIKAIVKDTSAARNGVLLDHHLTEVNGQNVIGLKDKAVGEVFSQSPPTVTITIMPDFVYNHLMKNMGSSLRKQMDHSIPDV
ncbi:syntenin-1-like [Halichondria panicea]|uniref:syntenin-1-like n=1 Tax=Halichondria panicea TaxID=6063 RepID=UPI00312B937A